MRKHNPIPILSFLVCVIVSACGKPAAPIGVRIRPEMAGLLDRTAWSIVSSVGKEIEAELLRIPGDEEAAKEPDTFFYLSGAWRLAENAGSEDGPPFAMVVAAGVPVAAIAGSPPILEWLDSDSDMTPNLVELLVLSDPAAYDVLPTHLEVRKELDEGLAQARRLPMLESDGVLAGSEGKIFFQARAAAEAFVGRDISGESCTVNGEDSGCDPRSWPLGEGWNTVRWGSGEATAARSFFVGAGAPKTEIQEHAKGVNFACKGDLPGEIRTADALTGSTGCLFECAVGDKGYRFCPLLTYIPVGPGVMAMRVRARSVTGAVDGAPARWKYRTPPGVVAKNAAARIQLAPQRGKDLRYCVDREDRCVPSRSYQEPLAMQCSTNGCSFYVRMTEHTGGKMAAPLRSAMFVNDTDLPTLSHSGDDAWHKKAEYTWTVEASDLGSPITAMRYCVGPPGADYCGAVDTLDRVVTAGENTGGTDAETPYAYSFPFGEADLGGWMAELCTGGVCEIEVAFIVEDSAGNRSDADSSTGETNPHHFLLRLDDTAPTMLVSAPAATNTDATVQVAVSDTGAGVPTALLCVVPVGQTTCTPDTPVSLDAGGKGSYVVPFRNGTVQLYLQATDAAGNSSEVKGLTITFDRNGPLITIPAVDVIGNGSEIEVQIYEGSGSGITAVTACFGVSGSGICPEGSPAWAPSGTDRQGFAITMSATTAAGSSEVKTLIVVAMDAGGNVSVGERTFTVDGTPPGLTLTAPATLMTTAVPLVLTTASSDAGVGEVSVRYCSSILSPAGGAALKAPYSLSGTDVPPCSVPGGSLSVGGEIRVTPPPRSTGGYASVVVVCAQASDGAQNAGDVVCTHILVDNVGGECTVETGGDGWHKWSGSWTGLHELGSAASWVEEGILYVARCTDPGWGEIKGMKVDTWANGKSGLRFCSGAGCVPGTSAAHVAAVRSAPVYSVPLAGLNCPADQVCKRVLRHQLIDPLGNAGPVREKEMDIDLAPPSAGSVNVSEHGRSAVVRVTEEGSGLGESEMIYSCDGGWEDATGTVTLGGSRKMEAEYCVGSCLLDGYTDKALVGCKAPASEYGTLTTTASVTLKLRDAVGNQREEHFTLKKEELRPDQIPPTISVARGAEKMGVMSPVIVRLEQNKSGVGLYDFKLYCASDGSEADRKNGNLNHVKSGDITLTPRSCPQVCAGRPLEIVVMGTAANRFGAWNPEGAPDEKWRGSVPLDVDKSAPNIEIGKQSAVATITVNDNESGIAGGRVEVTCRGVDGQADFSGMQPDGNYNLGMVPSGETRTLEFEHTCPVEECLAGSSTTRQIYIEAWASNCDGAESRAEREISYVLDCVKPVVEGVYEATGPDGGRELDVWPGGNLPISVKAHDPDTVPGQPGTGIKTVEAFLYWGKTDESTNACNPEKVYEEWSDASRSSYRSIRDGQPLTMVLKLLDAIGSYWAGSVSIGTNYPDSEVRVTPVTQPKLGRRWYVGVKVTDRAGNEGCSWGDGFWPVPGTGHLYKKMLQWGGTRAGEERGTVFSRLVGGVQSLETYPPTEDTETIKTTLLRHHAISTVGSYGSKGVQVVGMTEHGGKTYSAVLLTVSPTFLDTNTMPAYVEARFEDGSIAWLGGFSERVGFAPLSEIYPMRLEPGTIGIGRGGSAGSIPNEWVAFRRADNTSDNLPMLQSAQVWILENHDRYCKVADLALPIGGHLVDVTTTAWMARAESGWVITLDGYYAVRQSSILGWQESSYHFGEDSGLRVYPSHSVYFDDRTWGGPSCGTDLANFPGVNLSGTIGRDNSSMYRKDDTRYPGPFEGPLMINRYNDVAMFKDWSKTGKTIYATASVPDAAAGDYTPVMTLDNDPDWRGDDWETGWFTDGTTLKIPMACMDLLMWSFDQPECGVQIICPQPIIPPGSMNATPKINYRARALGPLFKDVVSADSAFVDIEINADLKWDVTQVPYGHYHLDRGCNLHVVTIGGEYKIYPAE